MGQRPGTCCDVNTPREPAHTCDVRVYNCNSAALIEPAEHAARGTHVLSTPADGTGTTLPSPEGKANTSPGNQNATFGGSLNSTLGRAHAYIACRWHAPGFM
eukprot:5537591-Prymnesium_polylepis.2